MKRMKWMKDRLSESWGYIIEEEDGGVGHVKNMEGLGK